MEPQVAHDKTETAEAIWGRDETAGPPAPREVAGETTAGDAGEADVPALTVSQISRLLGLTRSSVHRYLRQRQFPGAHKDGRGLWRIPVRDLMAGGFLDDGVDAAEAGDSRGAPHAPGDEARATLEAKVERLRAENRALRERLARARGMALEREQRVEDLRTALKMLPGVTQRLEKLLRKRELPPAPPVSPSPPAGGGRGAAELESSPAPEAGAGNGSNPTGTIVDVNDGVPRGARDDGAKRSSGRGGSGPRVRAVPGHAAVTASAVDVPSKPARVRSAKDVWRDLAGAERRGDMDPWVELEALRIQLQAVRAARDRIAETEVTASWWRRRRGRHARTE